MEAKVLEDPQIDDIAPVLRDSELFKALKTEHYAQILKIAEVERFEAEDTVVEVGSDADAFYLVIEGEASIRVPSPTGEPVELGKIRRSASFGEMGLLLGHKRTASVVAATPLTVLKFSEKGFHAMFQKIPKFGVGLSAGLAGRLDQLSAQIPLPSYDPRKGSPDPATFGMLPREFCQRQRVVALELDGKVLTVGTVEDPSSATMSGIRQHVTGVELNPVRIERAFFDEVMQSNASVAELPGDDSSESPSVGSPELDELLRRMVAEGASDLHLSAHHRPHWRINGDMQELADGPVLGTSQVHDLLRPVVAQRHEEEFQERNDVDFAYAVPGLARFRVNLFKDHRGTGAVFRVIPSNISSIEQLGLPDVVRSFCDIPKGLVLVTGPTGSGKSTTLAAMVDHINATKKLHVITLEDPIEFVHQSKQCLINQREIGGHAESFARGLKAALREDPDVVLVGEMRDLETISRALEIANTGHLVFATLHTNTAVSTVDRIIDQFPADEQAQVRSVLGDVLRGVITQTLVKKKDGNRTAALEVLVVNHAVSNLIREGKTVQIPSIMQTSKASGMRLLNDVLAELVETRKVELTQAMSYAVDKKELERRFRTGIRLAVAPQAADRFQVTAVQPNSPAARAGFRHGMVIAEIDGRQARDYTLDEARSTLRLDGKHEIVVEVQGKKQTITMELSS